ncbi:MAG TPA: L,D-transpeptidase family protein [Sphingomicrobium sp.]|nr:L,D-transpeptidase family protein [Sphingomicrobium sp.]
MKRLIELGFLACVAASAAANPETHQKLSVIEKAATLGPGQFVWEPKAASTGPLFLVIDLTRQRVLLYRGGVLVAASTISSGSEGRETPTGVFTILEKKVVHRSRTYDDAPMPYMQRLTAKGVAMHAGNLPGYPASHGCIRLPNDFAKLLYGVTELGTPVMITDDEQVRKAAERERMAAEYQSTIEELSRKKAGLQADAERALAEFDRAKAAHEVTLRQHDAKMAKYKSEIASK